MFMIKSGLTLLGLNKGTEVMTSAYNLYASNAKLSEKRRAAIEDRRSQLKVEDSDPRELKIVIEEMLSYMPTSVSLDDRYLQLESILDKIDEAKSTKKIEGLVSFCKALSEEISSSPGVFKNSFLERLVRANLRIEQTKIKAKL